MKRPLCFVLMPGGTRPDRDGALVNYDALYRDVVAPAILEAGLEPLWANSEALHTVLEKATIEQLTLCPYAVADLTTAKADVYYALGLRHALRPAATVVISSEAARLPIDNELLRALAYRLDGTGSPENPASTRSALAARLRAAAQAEKADRPIFELVEQFPDIQRLKTDVFRDRVEYAPSVKQRLAEARGQGIEAVRAVEQASDDIAAQESGVVIDLLLSYRAVQAWEQMAALVGKMSRPLAETVMVQEQLALALNRAGHSARAEAILKELIDRRGPNSETCSLLGRVYKDRWEAAQSRGEQALAGFLLDQAIEAYLRGFEADWRDAYPGVNAVTLMTLREPPDERRDLLLPIVSYAAERRIAAGNPDYWDYATRLELAVLRKDQAAAESALADALAAVRETFEPESTARNLRLIRQARGQRQTAEPWMRQLEQRLLGEP